MKITINDQLFLQPLRMDDKEPLARYINDQDIHNNTLTIPFPYTEKDAETFIKLVLERSALYGLTNNWSIQHREHGFIGDIGLQVNYGVESHKDAIGYWLARPFWGQGIMTEVIKTFSDYCFEYRELSRLEATVFTHNIGSIRVLEKAGFEQEGMMRKAYVKGGRYLDAFMYARII